MPDRLLPVDQTEVATAIAYGLRFDERGKPRRGPARPLSLWPVVGSA